MFSGLLEALRTDNNRIQDRVTLTAREYYRNQFQGNFNPNGIQYNMDNDVIQMVEEYFNSPQNGLFRETESLWVEITNHTFNTSNVHTINVNVHLRNLHHGGRVRYILIKNEVGIVRILEKLIEPNR